SKLYYLKYYLASGGDVDASAEGNVVHKDEKGYYAVVATTRPETIMGDTAMCINPKDAKNQWLHGHKVIVPLVGREVPVIEDRYVDIEFGTGCLKVTPAHDHNDYMLGKTHNLQSIDIFNPDATISEEAGLYVGMDRFACRRQIVKDLDAAGLLEKVEEYTNKVGYSERNPDTAVEPRLSLQWFLKMQHFADMALPPVMNDEIKFYPTKYKVTYKNWLENIQDWCISRQLWWGHRIPAWYYPTANEADTDNYVVALTREEALALAIEKTGNKALQAADLAQDEDALDTWFSSWLWPISLFRGINNPEDKELSYYYPTSDLVTAPDIIFFWVARMIMSGYEYQGKMPFRNVYFTGLVRDKLGRKMSKQLGNSPDPLKLIKDYGADGVRMGMLLCTSAGNDILFDESQVEQGRNFCNKIWNAYRLVKGWSVADVAQPEAAKVAVEWFSNALDQALATINDHFGKFRINDALMTIYKLFWDDFCAWYLELVKPAFGSPIDSKTYNATICFFDKVLKVLHPFMPFITEELWQNIEERKAGETIMLQQQPAPAVYSEKVISDFALITSAVVEIRALRQSKGISPKEQLILKVKGEGFPKSMSAALMKMANISAVEQVEEFGGTGQSFMVGTLEFFVPLEGMIDVEAEKAKIESEIARYEGFLKGVNAKLSNARFVENAPAAVVEMERKKLADATLKIENLRERLATLG
ncbi:MAG: valine--tRNA ligase, partial [Bacteroidales bacterium]|nr:valine--tRNA ligase [Bacteroidales bacterium]